MYKHAGVGRICDNFNFGGRSLPQEASDVKIHVLASPKEYTIFEP